MSDLYNPAGAEDGGPFTIGRVIHTARSVGVTSYIGGVAVFGRALTKEAHSSARPRHWRRRSAGSPSPG